jgi:hypothetical protein
MMFPMRGVEPRRARPKSTKRLQPSPAQARGKLCDLHSAAELSASQKHGKEGAIKAAVEEFWVPSVHILTAVRLC